MRRNCRGVGRAETLAGCACVSMLFAIAATALGGGGNGEETLTRRIRDARYAKQIHKAMILYSRDANGVYPRPGLIDRLPVTINRRTEDIPGRGAEDVALNTTANLFSAMIAQNYFTCEMAVSPVDRNPKAAVFEGYDFDAYDPIRDAYWDDRFAADLETGSNVSYAHMPMFGGRAKAQWRETTDRTWPILGNRGPLAGEPDWRSYTCGPHGSWAGHVVFQDNRVALLETMTPDEVVYELKELERPDNIFAMETGSGGSDAILTFTRKIATTSLEIQHD
jgi:hypothetical protein